MIDAAGGWPSVLLRFLALAATTGTVGAWVFSRFVAGRMTGAVAERHRQSLGHLGVRAAIWCSALLVLAAALPVLRARGDWGHAAQAVAAAITGAALLRGRRTQPWPRLATGSVALLVVIPAFLGHAAAGEWRVLSVLMDVVHVAAAGGWVGALALLTIATLRARRETDGPALSAALIVAFHPVAMVAASTVFVTGLLTAWLRMGVPVGIASSSYSGLFVAKLLLVGVTAALGAGHSKLARRRVPSVDLASIGRSLLAESLLALLVLVVTAVLAGTDAIG